jgi:esterase/lipase superfamily enzyme
MWTARGLRLDHLFPRPALSTTAALLLAVLMTGCGARDQESQPENPSASSATKPSTNPDDNPASDLTVPGDLVEPPPDDVAMAGTDEAVQTADADPTRIPRDGPPTLSPGFRNPDSTPRRVIRRDGETTERRGFTSEHVFYATNRAPETLDDAQFDPDLFFSGERGALSYGRCEVSIPYRRQPGELPEPSLLRLEFSQDPSRHVVLMEIEQLPEADFWLELRAKVDESPDKQLLIFVHGYCATFRDAARRTAQIAYDLNYPGPGMFFSWPAGSDTESFSDKANYLKDLRRAEQSDDDLITVLEGISRYSGATRIHLVAHSMGNFILSEALKTLDDRRGGQPVTALFDQVALAAPDLDAREFVERVGARIKPFSRRFTVYASAGDKALAVSQSVNDFEPLGYLNDHTRRGATQQLFDLIDASQLTTNWFDSGHIYYGDMPEVLKDFGFVFNGVQAASLQRGLAETPPLFRLPPRNP